MVGQKPVMRILKKALVASAPRALHKNNAISKYAKLDPKHGRNKFGKPRVGPKPSSSPIPPTKVPVLSSLMEQFELEAKVDIF